MLVLSRKKNEEILIGDNVRIMVLEFRDDKVRIGIEAPSNVLILRAELTRRTPDGLAESSAELSGPSGEAVTRSDGLRSKVRR